MALRRSFRPPLLVVGFYEKVIKVKADVAALLMFASATFPQKSLR